MPKFTLAEARKLGVPESQLAGLEQAKKPARKKVEYRGLSPQELLFNLLKRDLEGAVWEHKPLADRQYRLDIAFPDLLVGIEVDGFQFHGINKKNFQRDRDKRNLLSLAGWMVLAFTAKDVITDPKRCAAQVASALQRRARERPASELQAGSGD